MSYWAVNLSYWAIITKIHISSFAVKHTNINHLLTNTYLKHYLF